MISETILALSDQLDIYVIYNSVPPFKIFIARKDIVADRKAIRDPFFDIRAYELETLRDYFRRQGLVMISRYPQDTFYIVETWL